MLAENVRVKTLDGEAARLVIIRGNGSVADLQRAASAAYDVPGESRTSYAVIPGYHVELAGASLLTIVKYLQVAARCGESPLLGSTEEFSTVGKLELRVIDIDASASMRGPLTQWSQAFVDAVSTLGWDEWTPATTQHYDELRAANKHVRGVVALEGDAAMLVKVLLPGRNTFEVRVYVLHEGDVLFFVDNAGASLEHATAVRKRGVLGILDLEALARRLSAPRMPASASAATSTHAAAAVSDSDQEMTFDVNGQRFVISAASLDRLGKQCMLNQAVEASSEAEVHSVAWPEPLTLEGFALVMEWATTTRLRNLTPNQYSQLFRAADALNVPEIASLGLSLGPPPSQADTDNYMLLLAEEPYYVDIEPTTFIVRHNAVDAPLPLGGMPLLFHRRRHRAGAALFTTPNLLKTAIEEALPPEARLCLAQGLCLAGGFAARITAHLAGLCEARSLPAVGTNDARPDIDFFMTTGDSETALRMLRATLIALARHCESRQVGMCVVRSPYAVTVAMDDCDYDLQIVLCAFDSMEDVLSNFDIDACRVAYDGTRLIASETFLRAIVSGTIVARPQFESLNHAKRLHKYATLQDGGFNIAIADFDPTLPGKTPMLLRELEREWDQHADTVAGPDTVVGQNTVVDMTRPGWEVPFTDADMEMAEATHTMRTLLTEPPAAHTHPFGTNPALYALPEDEEGPRWGSLAAAPPEYVPPAPQWNRFIRNHAIQQPGFTYSSANAREVVEVWREQRRRPRAAGVPMGMCAEGEAPPLDHEDYWRFSESSALAARLTAGGFRPRNAVADDLPADHAGVAGWGTTIAKQCVIKDVVFQTLDMHPIRGAWNAKQKAFLATAVETEALIFLDFIEDAALVVPKSCRAQMTRCMQVPTRASAGSAHFRPSIIGAATWPSAEPTTPQDD